MTHESIFLSSQQWLQCKPWLIIQSLISLILIEIVDRRSTYIMDHTMDLYNGTSVSFIDISAIKFWAGQTNHIINFPVFFLEWVNVYRLYHIDFSFRLKYRLFKSNRHILRYDRHPQVSPLINRYITMKFRILLICRSVWEFGILSLYNQTKLGHYRLFWNWY